MSRQTFCLAAAGLPLRRRFQRVHSAHQQQHRTQNTALVCALLPTCTQVQLVRIQLRVPEYGWTTQKVFHLLNALVCSLRCGSFLFRGQMQQLHPDAVRLVLFDLPGK